MWNGSINGIESEKFALNKGTRQGDLLFDIIFILTIEPHVIEKILILPV